MVIAANIPEDLRRRPAWVLWRYEEREGKRTKVPYQIDGHRARSNDPSTWTDFERAFSSVEHFSGGVAEMDGIGIMLADGLAGVDLDKCIDEAGVVKPWAQEVIDELASYAEISPSGRGVKVFLLGEVPEGGNRVKVGDGEIEFYSGGRYFTVTGQRLEGAPEGIAHRQGQLEAVHGRVFEAKDAPPSIPEFGNRTQGGGEEGGAASRQPDDGELLEKAFSAANGAKFRDLWEGGGGSDASAGDLALCTMLAFWTGGDSARMDSMFRQSRRMRDKWHTKHSSDGRTYGQMTIDKAIATTTEFYSPGDGQGGARAAEHASSVEHLVGTAEGEQPQQLPSMVEAAERLVETVEADHDVDLVWKAVPILARLSRADYARTKARLRQALKDVLNLADLDAAVKEERSRKRKARSRGEEGLPVIALGRQLRDVLMDAVAALERGNEPPELFVRAGTLVAITRDEHERPVIAPLNRDALRGRLAHAATWIRYMKGGEEVNCSPPDDVTGTVGAQGEWSLPGLEGVVEHPLLRRDGTVLAKQGYDPVTRFYYQSQTHLTLPPIPNNPTEDDVQRAVETIMEPIAEFPYADGAGLANTIAMFLTPLARAAIRGPIPAAVINAHVQGSGKTLLADVGALIATGRPAGMVTAPQTDEEWQKVILATVSMGTSCVVIDNVEYPLGNGALCSALTAETIEGRILGRTEIGRYSHTAQWVITGNNVRLKAEMPRRCYWVSLDPAVPRPWQRGGFAIGDLRGWVREQRPQLCAALLTLLRAWYAAGQPQAEGPLMGSFEEWQRIIGGTLAHAGVDGFLANIEDMYEMADADSSVWEGFLTAWERVSQEPVTTRGLATLCEDHPALLETVPDWTVDSRGINTRKLGNALASKLGARFGERQVRIERVRTIRKVAEWLVCSEAAPPLAAAADDPGADLFGGQQ